MKIESLDLSNDPEPKPVGFWRRQFQIQPTSTQRRFDWAYGVVVPLVCVVLDPIVFNSQGILASYRPFAYLLSSVSILAMTAWLLWGKRLGWLAAPLSGLFFAGSIISFIVGVRILPYSLLGLLILIGFLGFTPLFSALVYLRNSIRAMHAAESVWDQRTVWQAATLAAMFGLVIPYVASVRISQIVNEIATGDVNTIHRESEKLKYIKPLADMTPVGKRYYQRSDEEINSPRMKELAKVYQEFTGKKVEFRIMD